MRAIKFLGLICYFSLFIFFGCTTLNISATNNNNNAFKFESVIKKTRKSVVLLSTNPNIDPTTDPKQNALCSGVVVNGGVLTNFHCVYKQNHIKLYYYDKNDWKQYDVDVIGEDPLADLALLKVIGKEESIPYLKFADNVEEIEEGTEVFALGHPMGMVWTVTKGIISSNERYARHPYIKALQTDASINKGNSGGPLLNMKGEIIGINALIISRISENAGIALAIRGDVVKSSYESMLDDGKVDRPAVGVMIKNLASVKNRKKFLEEFPKQDPNYIPNTYGLLIHKDENIPKGLKAFDTIIGVNDVLINDGLQFSDELRKYKIGDIITLTIIRKQVFLRVDVPLKVFPVPVETMYGKRPNG
jgi:S1-C subfamily serine protease